MVGKIAIGNQIREKHIRFESNTDYDRYINAIDLGYNSEDANFNGFIYIIKTPHFSLVNRSQ